MSGTAVAIVVFCMAGICGLAPALARRFIWGFVLAVIGLIGIAAFSFFEPLVGIALWLAALLTGFIVASRAKRDDYRERLRRWEHETLLHEMRYGKSSRGRMD